VMIKTSSLPEIQPQEEEAITEASPAARKTSIFQFPHLLLGVLCIFFYVGAEVLVGDGIGTFGKALGISLDQTKYFTSLPLMAMLLGYIIGIITIPRYVSQSSAMKVCALSAFVFGAGVLLTTGYTAIAFIVLLGLSNSLMWPAIWPLALEGLGRFTKLGSALLIMGIAGGAAFPPLYGGLKDNAHVPNNLAYCICIFPCYAYILYYAVRGHKAGR
jgi:MFS transporter, FHS family, L-fucose permease